MFKMPNLSGANRQVTVLLLSTFVIGALWILTQHLTFGMDSKTYLEYARWISGDAGISPIWYLRGPALPAFLVATGVTKLHTFAFFILAQLLVSVAIVWFCYKIAQTLNPKFALTAAYLCIISTIPFIFSNAVLTEHLNVFAYLLLVYSILYLRETGAVKYARYAALANILLFLLRPSNYYIFIISLFFVIFFTKQHRKQNIKNFILLFGTVALLYVGGFGLLKQAHPGLEGFSATPQALRALVYQPYSSGNLLVSNGSATMAVHETVQEYIKVLPPQMLAELEPKKLFGSLAGTPDKLTQQIFAEPNGYYYNFITKALVAKYGRTAASKILLQAVAESYMAHPLAALDWIRSIFSCSANNYAGQMLFYQFMLKSEHVVSNESDKKHTTISIANGPATAELLQRVAEYIDQQRTWVYWDPKELFRDLPGAPATLLPNMLENPNHIYHWFMWQAIDRELGPIKAQELFLHAALEGYAKHPTALLSVFDDLTAYFFGADVTYKSGSRVIFLPNTGMGESVITPDMTVNMQASILQPYFPVPAQIWAAVYNAYGIFWLLAKPLIFIGSLVGLVMSLRNKNFTFYALIWSLTAYNALIITIFADPFFRYSALTWLLNYLGAAYLIYDLLQRIKLEKRVNNVATAAVLNN